MGPQRSETPARTDCAKLEYAKFEIDHILNRTFLVVQNIDPMKVAVAPNAVRKVICVR